MKNVNFVPKDVQRILSSHIRIMNRKYSTRKLFLRISHYSQENRTQTQVFFANIDKFLRRPILKDIFERLLLRDSFELFHTWTNNIGSEEDVFSKIKQNKNGSKTQLYEKILAFSWCSLSFRFSLFLTSRQRHLPYIIIDDISESFETA